MCLIYTSDFFTKSKIYFICKVVSNLRGWIFPDFDTLTNIAKMDARGKNLIYCNWSDLFTNGILLTWRWTHVFDACYEIINTYGHFMIFLFQTSHFIHSFSSKLLIEYIYCFQNCIVILLPFIICNMIKQWCMKIAPVQ